MNFHDLVFYSKHHYRFECGVEIGGGAAKRAIRIQDSISGNEGYSVTIYDTEENASVEGGQGFHVYQTDENNFFFF